MSLNLEPVKKWFGYNRKERRASYMLLVIIIVILAVRVVVPEKEMDIEDITEDILAISSADLSDETGLFSFDPNTASFDTLLKLGFRNQEARILISYRTSGGRFRQPSDLKKLYGLEGSKADKIIPFVRIQQDTATGQRHLKMWLDLNTCDSAMLEKLPGIGPVLSARIIKYRNLLGGFALVEQLNEVYGLSAETFSLIKGMVYADTSIVRKININSAGYNELSRMPYFKRYEVTAILKYKELQGRITGIDELVVNKIISERTASRISPYLVF